MLKASANKLWRLKEEAEDSDPQRFGFIEVGTFH
jgi:hypothetical protein